MIVTCPQCSARYKINESKVKGRGAKITCPKCSHRFVFYMEDGPGKSAVPDNVGQLDFSTLGITWRVRKNSGTTLDFFDLATLESWIRDGQVDRWDQISYDRRTWASIDAISDLRAYFHDIYQKARHGEISLAAPEDAGSEGGEDEDDSDAPTTIVGRGSSLASEIRAALADTPEPAPGREGFKPISINTELDEEGPAEILPGDSRKAPTPEAAAPKAAPVARPREPDPVPEPIAAAKPPPPAPKPAAPAPKPAAPAPSGGGLNPAVIGGGILVVLLVIAAAVWGSGMLGGHAPPEDLRPFANSPTSTG